MKKIFTLMFALAGCCGFAMAQEEEEVNDSYQFINAAGEIIENGSTIVMQNVEKEEDPGTGEITYKVPADFQVKNVSNSFGEAVRLCMNITRIDNGEFSTCALGNCIPPKSEVGELFTSAQKLDMGQRRSAHRMVCLRIRQVYCGDADGDRRDCGLRHLHLPGVRSQNYR